MTELQTIVKGCLKQDRRAQKLLYETYFSFLMSVCYRYKNNKDDAVFLLNTGFIKILEKLKSYDFNKPIEPWLKTIMVNVAIDEFRKNKKYNQNNVLLDDLQWKYFESENDFIDEDAELQNEDYWELVRKLPEPCRTVFNLFVMEDFGHKEIAEKLEISERSSKRHLSVAKQWLQEQIKMQYVKVRNYG